MNVAANVPAAPVRSTAPTVSVGVPAYAAEATLRIAIDSILAQTFQDFEVIVSDDLSPDGTWAICQEFAARDSRIRVFRQSRNLYYLNFGFVLDQARAPFFVWLAGDDRWQPEFLARCLEGLKAHPDAICCAPRCAYFAGGQVVRVPSGTYPIAGNWSERVARYLGDISRTATGNCRMYGLYRSAPLRRCLPRVVMHAWDIAFVAASLRYGSHVEVPEVLIHRDFTPPQNYVTSVPRDHRSPLLRLFPAVRISLFLLARRRVPLRWKVLSPLIRLNLNEHMMHVRRFRPRYYRAARPLYLFLRRYLLWRL